MVNRVEVRGGLTRDPEVRALPSGLLVWNATVAVNGTRYDVREGKQVVKTTFVRVAAFGSVADDAVDLAVGKGDEVYVLGELDNHETEKPDGTKERKTTVAAYFVKATRRRAPRPAAPPADEPPGGWDAPPDWEVPR